VTVATRRARADRVRGRRAGLISRLLADGIDLVVTGMILFGALIGFAVVRYMVGSAPLRLPRVSGVFTAVAFPLTEIVYLAITWAGSGRSVGKSLVGLRVVRAEGARLGRLQATVRAVLCTFFGGPSLLWAAFSSRNAAVHDLVLHTTVVHDWSDEVRTEIAPRESPLVAAP
jgi:uncharacterized RDD family membrane protein YckC